MWQNMDVGGETPLDFLSHSLVEHLPIKNVRMQDLTITFRLVSHLILMPT